ncbi:TPA: transcriptional regulator [Streptococcus agalactiae]
MPQKNALTGMDQFRNALLSEFSQAKIIDVLVIGQETFMMCELEPHVFITENVFADVHPNLITIPLESEFSLPYDLIYSNNPSSSTLGFIKTIADSKLTFSID